MAVVSDDVGTPEDLTATASGNNQINLSWNIPGILGTTDITGYRIEVAESANSTNWAVLAADTGSTTRTYTHTGLPPGATRHYRVAAIDDAGTGSLSKSASATTTGSPSGPVFTNAYLTVIRQSVSVRFSKNLLETPASWPTPSAFTVKTDGAAVTVGSVIVSGNQVLLLLGSTVDEGAATTLSYADPSSGNDESAVQDLSGNDAPSFTGQPVAEPKPMANTDVPGKPTGLAATFDGTELEMSLTWSAPSATGGSAVTGYKVERSTDNNNWEALEENHSTTTYVDTNVAHGNTYYYRVSAINDDGPGLPSEVLKVDDESPPALVSASVPSTGASVQLQFTEALYNTVTMADLDDSYTVTASGLDITGSSVTISGSTATLGLSTGEKIHKGETVTVSYTDPTTGDDANALQDSSGNDAATFTGVAADHNNSRVVRKPFPPTSLSATGGENRIALAWTVPKRSGGSPITGYRIEHSTDSGTTWDVLAANTGTATTGYTDRPLPVSTTRHYRVSAINREGNSDPSGDDNATTSATGDTTGPTLDTAQLGEEGSSTVLRFNEELEDASGKTAPLTAFTLKADGTAVTLTSATTDGTKKEVTLEHTGDVINEESSVTVSYQDPSTGDDTAVLQDLLGNDAASFTDQAVTNSSTVAAPLKPCDPNAPEQLWCATLTVGTGTNSDSETLLGYQATGSRGTLSPSTFTRGTATIVVEKLQYTDATDGDLEFEVKLDSGTTPAEGLLGTVDLILKVNTLTFMINNPGTTTSFSFTDHGVSWTKDQEVRVRLTRAPSEPDAPTGLNATANGATQINLSWATPARDGGKAITGYRVEWSADGSTGWTELAASHNGTTYSHTGLMGGTTRHYRVSGDQRRGNRTSLPDSRGHHRNGRHHRPGVLAGRRTRSRGQHHGPVQRGHKPGIQRTPRQERLPGQGKRHNEPHCQPDHQRRSQ